MKKFATLFSIAIVCIVLLQGCCSPKSDPIVGAAQFDSTRTIILSYDWSTVIQNGNFSIIPTGISNASPIGNYYDWTGDFDNNGYMLNTRIVMDTILSAFENQFKVKVTFYEVRDTKQQLYLLVNHSPINDTAVQRLISINEGILKENQSLKHEISLIKESQVKTTKILKELLKKPIEEKK